MTKPKMNRLCNLLIDFIFRKEVNEMAVVYATLIVKGKKTFAQVPAKLQAEVREILLSLDCPDLAE